MTPEDTQFLADIEALAEKATPEHDDDQPDEACAACGDIPDTADREWNRGDLCWPCQAELFNALRAAIPLLVGMVRAQEKELAELRAMKKRAENLARFVDADVSDPTLKTIAELVGNAVRGTAKVILAAQKEAGT